MTTKRYTAKQLRDMAKKLHYSGTDEFSDEASFMLNQAAEDAEFRTYWESPGDTARTQETKA